MQSIAYSLSPLCRAEVDAHICLAARLGTLHPPVSPLGNVWPLSHSVSPPPSLFPFHPMLKFLPVLEQLVKRLLQKPGEKCQLRLSW